MRGKRRPKTASLHHEQSYHAFGYRRIFGIDEAGRGAWAGPVVAGAVCLPAPNDALSQRLAGVRDSKQMSPRQREQLAETIKDVALAWGVGFASCQEIDTYGIVPATKRAMGRALQAAMRQTPDVEPDYLFLDAMPWEEAPVTCAQMHMVRGDQESLTIAAASVLAKVERDAFMRDLDAGYPGYSFGQHKGYGTRGHREALQTLGVSNQHRTCYRPIRILLEGEAPG
jgi:ribonuclease HII